MARKILGIDIGSHSVKFVLGRERFGKTEILEVYEKPVNGNGGEGLQELIKSMVSDNNKLLFGDIYTIILIYLLQMKQRLVR